MNTVLQPGPRTGTVPAPSSKSQAHRLLICAALGHRPTRIRCDSLSRDIEATVACLNALGAHIENLGDGILSVTPVDRVPEGPCHLYCGESGSTLRFLLPVAGVLGAKAVFHMEGRLPRRPLAPFDQLLRAGGMEICKEADLLYTDGKLNSGSYSIPGDISSQYISGLLMALPLAQGDSSLQITGGLESAPYITMTEQALIRAGLVFEKHGRDYILPGGQRPLLPPDCTVEGDYSGAAFLLCMGALSRDGITVTGLDPASAQGDRAVLEILARFGARVTETAQGITVRHGPLRAITVDAAPIPDLIPPLAVIAAAAAGETHIIHAGRLRLKESDRLRATADLLTALGADVTELPEGLIIRGGKPLTGGTVSSWGDHRIAMSAALAASLCTGPVEICDSQCTEKSYPAFWRDLASLKGVEP